MQSETSRILVVDDEVKIADRLSERLRLRGFETFALYDGQSALDFLDQNSIDNMILDLRLPDIDGIDVLRHTRKAFPSIRVIILSGHGTEADFSECLALGAHVCLQKPAKMEALMDALSDESSTIGK